MASPSNVVRARPSKSFFIDMLTRDLSLTECILDLVDNAIDKAVHAYKIDVMDVLLSDEPKSFPPEATIEIEYSDRRFRIHDTCGGISVADARQEIFNFGNARPRKTQGGLSVYGIGMKRAFFKMGRKIVLKSATNKERFQIDFDVDEWRKDEHENWDLEFTNQNKTGASRGHSRAGTQIEITRLHDSVRKRFRQTSFGKDLLNRIQAAYAVFLEAGINIVLNGKKAKATLPVLGTGTYDPVSTRLNKGGVDVVIVAGVTPKNDKTPHGWYVFCNGRMVLDADKTSATGWGPGQQFHTKYNHFAGYAYFRSEDGSKLPWTTTKQEVDVDSPIYQLALREMQLQARPILRHLSRLYPGEREAEDIPEREAIEKAKPEGIKRIAKRASTFKVNVNSKGKSGDELKTIQYKKRLKEVDKVRKAEGDPKLSFAKIGELTFDYYIEREC